jgi:hypothetical protein
VPVAHRVATARAVTPIVHFARHGPVRARPLIVCAAVRTLLRSRPVRAWRRRRACRSARPRSRRRPSASSSTWERREGLSTKRGATRYNSCVTVCQLETAETVVCTTGGGV